MMDDELREALEIIHRELKGDPDYRCDDGLQPEHYAAILAEVERLQALVEQLTKDREMLQDVVFEMVQKYESDNPSQDEWEYRQQTKEFENDRRGGRPY